MKKITISLIVLLIVASINGCTTKSDKNEKFGVIIGDSIAEGHPVLHGRLHPGHDGFDPDYPDKPGQLSYELAQLYGFCFYNQGIGSQTTNDVWNRWARDVLVQEQDPSDGRGNRTLTTKPKIVVVSAGINDVAG